MFRCQVASQSVAVTGFNNDVPGIYIQVFLAIPTSDVRVTSWALVIIHRDTKRLAAAYRQAYHIFFERLYTLYGAFRCGSVRFY